MATPTVEDYKWSRKELVEAAITWHNFNGFTADQCWTCKRTANVIHGGPGWFCVCGEFNMLSIHGATIPHDRPVLGPTRVELLKAFRKARRINNRKWRIRRCMELLQVLLGNLKLHKWQLELFKWRMKKFGLLCTSV